MKLPFKAFISYKNGRNVEGNTGELVADFDGSHGWFRRNRSSSDVTITLKADGEYQNIQNMG